ncbi:aquaporin [Lysobacter gummosus]|uniref:Aquaporin family protein n=1 Tax=Lysobacter gummosus TaxID=262324 RepID=A0ABY3XCR2_9GAMM|nr:MIP/aquaporin family protein [Lysobacter gummosus]ALN91938.1 major intrinsic family protein [Lysobacter gummosus]UNP27593.1 aquaporin family protein [Lysobacter gummosus]
MIRQRLFAEFLATSLLLVTVVGSGIMAERLAGGNDAVALMANTLATVGGLYILIELFRPVSGAHMNPAVSTVMAMRGELSWPLLPGYIVVQLLGAACGAWLANAMFDLPLLEFSTKARTGLGQWLGEIVATAGLLLVVLRAPSSRVAAMVAAYIGAAYWFTSSTSFANPAASFGRMFSDSFAGIAPDDVPAFIAAQILGATLGAAINKLVGTADRV